MSFDLKLLQESLCKSLCGDVQLRKTKQGLLQVVTPFLFPDGDVFQVYLEEAGPGNVRFTDHGHTLMHLSYENDLTKFREGTRGKLLDQILAESGLKQEDGRFSLSAPLERIGAGVLQYGQALTRIYDLTFVNRARYAGTFYEDLKELLCHVVGEEKVQQDFILPGQAGAESYPIDFRLPGRRAPQVFVFGIATRDKARLATIILEHWLRARIDFDSLLVFADQQEIPRADLARLSNVGGEMVASLDASDDLQRKIVRLAA